MTTLEEARSVVSRLGLEERLRLMDWLSRDSVEVSPGVFRTPGVCGGDACIRSMRLPVWMLEEGRRNGFSEEKFLEAYPELTRVDLRNAWAYVASHREEIDRVIFENSESCGLGIEEKNDERLSAFSNNAETSQNFDYSTK